MDRLAFCILRGRFIVDRISKNVKHSSQGLLSYRDGDRPACADSLHPPDQTVRRSHRNTSHGVIAQMLGNLYNQLPALLCHNINGVIDLRQMPVTELDI